MCPLVRKHTRLRAPTHLPYLHTARSLLKCGVGEVVGEASATADPAVREPDHLLAVQSSPKAEEEGRVVITATGTTQLAQAAARPGAM